MIQQLKVNPPKFLTNRNMMMLMFNDAQKSVDIDLSKDF